MKAEEVEVVSPSSSPPTPPSPLPVSVGPGNSKYYFSSSPSPSPPFSPPTSARTSADNLPLISSIKEEKEEEEGRRDSEAAAVVPSAFSLSLDPPYSQYPHSSSYNVSTCLQDILEWFALRCCSCCSLTLNPPKPHQS